MDEKLAISLEQGGYPISGNSWGEYEIPDLGFDWSMLGLDSNLASVKLQLEVFMKLDKITFVVFSSQSRLAVLVRPLDTPESLLEGMSSVHKISSRVAVTCPSKI